jgi:hypothetical protein
MAVAGTEIRESQNKKSDVTNFTTCRHLSTNSQCTELLSRTIINCIYNHLPWATPAPPVGWRDVTCGTTGCDRKCPLKIYSMAKVS